MEPAGWWRAAWAVRNIVCKKCLLLYRQDIGVSLQNMETGAFGFSDGGINAIMKGRQQTLEWRKISYEKG